MDLLSAENKVKNARSGGDTSLLPGAKLNLSNIIDTEKSITVERNSIVDFKYQLIGYYIDYNNLVK